MDWSSEPRGAGFRFRNRSRDAGIPYSSIRRVRIGSARRTPAKMLLRYCTLIPRPAAKSLGRKSLRMRCNRNAFLVSSAMDNVLHMITLAQR